MDIDIYIYSAYPCIPCTRMFVSVLSATSMEPSDFERPFRAPQQSRAGSSGHFERPCGAERARCRKRRQVRCFRAGQAEPSGLDVGNVGRCGDFEHARLSRAGSMSETSAGAVFSSRPGRAERARCRKRRQVRCFRAGQAEPSGLDVGNVGRCGVREARPSRVKLGSVQAVPGPLRRFNIRYIFKSWIHILLFFVSFFDELGALRSCSASHPL
jgi:hypothetical protein